MVARKARTEDEVFEPTAPKRSRQSSSASSSKKTKKAKKSPARKPRKSTKQPKAKASREEDERERMQQNLSGEVEADGSHGQYEEPDAFSEAFELFQGAQMAEDQGNDEKARMMYTDLVKKAEKKAEIKDDLDFTQERPSLRILVSVASNSVGGSFLEEKQIRQARTWLAKSLKHWPGNCMAQLNLANLEREFGDQDKALRLYEELAATALPKDNNDEKPEWVPSWVDEPLRNCIEMATYTAALILHQNGRYDDAVPLLKKFRFQYRIAPAVWEAASRNKSELDSANVERLEQVQLTTSDVPVRYLKNALDDSVLEALQNAFSPTSVYWKETDYKERGYYSFWYNVDQEPSNLVELAIHEMLPLVGRDDIVGAEWWVHSRPCGRNLGHQLHFDTEENTLQLEKEIVHPVVSSVTYLDGATEGGSTIVFQQGVHDTEPCSHAVVARPEQGGFLLFPGNALHGVLPGNVKSKAGGANRLTLLIGFWNKPVFFTGKRARLGPCSVFPPATRSCSWPSILQIPPSMAPHRNERQESNTGSHENLALLKVAPAWETLTEDEQEEVLDVPDSLDQRFFVHDFAEFKHQLLPPGIEEEPEEA